MKTKERPDCLQAVHFTNEITKLAEGVVGQVFTRAGVPPHVYQAVADIAQEALAAVWAKRKQLGPPRKVQAIVTHFAVLHAKAATQTAARRNRLNASGESEIRENFHSASAANPPEYIVDAEAVTDTLVAAIDDLQESQRDVLLLELDGVGRQERAERMDLRIAGMESASARGKHNLRNNPELHTVLEALEQPVVDVPVDDGDSEQSSADPEVRYRGDWSWKPSKLTESAIARGNRKWREFCKVNSQSAGPYHDEYMAMRASQRLEELSAPKPNRYSQKSFTGAYKPSKEPYPEWASHAS